MKITKMASLAVLFCTCFVIATGLGNAEKVFKVGDEFGWQEPGQNSSAVYTQWATRNRFQVGDFLCEFITVSSSHLLARYILGIYFPYDFFFYFYNQVLF
jgi:hypothetical protein